MDIGSYSSRGKLAIKGLRAQLDVYLGLAFEIDRPLKALGRKSRVDQHLFGPLDRVRRDDEVQILRHHRFGSPVIYCNPADGAPCEACFLKAFDKSADIVSPTE